MTDLEKRIYHKLDHLAEGVQHLDRNDAKNYISWVEDYTEKILEIIREVRLVEAGLVAEKVLRLLPKGTSTELDVGTTIEAHLFKRRKQVQGEMLEGTDA